MYGFIVNFETNRHHNNYIKSRIPNTIGTKQAQQHTSASSLLAAVDYDSESDGGVDSEEDIRERPVRKRQRTATVQTTLDSHFTRMKADGAVDDDGTVDGDEDDDDDESDEDASMHSDDE